MEGQKEGMIRERAYQLWVDDGRQHGKSEQYWAQAEEEIRRIESAAEGSPAKAHGAKSGSAPRAKKPEADPPQAGTAGSPAKGGTSAKAKPKTNDASSGKTAGKSARRARRVE